VITAVVLAAGRASRMGRTKQLLPIDGRPMLQRVVDTAAEAGLDEIVVVLGHDAEAVGSALELPAIARAVVNPSFATGQASSLRRGLSEASPESEAAVILLGDQPGLTAGAVQAVVDAYRRTGARVVRARYGRNAGHPVLLAREAWEELETLEGDVGARELIARRPEWVTDVDVPGNIPPDIDTEADYERLLRETEHP
jgi:molybdenum cofactor cytidylyltransferase